MRTHDKHEPETVDTKLGYERSDARVSGVVTFLVVLSIVAVVIGGIAFGFGKWMNARMNSEDGPKNRWVQPVDVRQLGNMASSAAMERAAGASTQSYPMPRVQTDDGNQDVADLHNREDLLLQNYSWADQSEGKVRIPIDRAMKLIALRGLPVETAAGPTTLMSGDVKAVVIAPLTDGFARTAYELERDAARGGRAR
jgi:hypothetical protein